MIKQIDLRRVQVAIAQSMRIYLISELTTYSFPKDNRQSIESILQEQGMLLEEDVICEDADAYLKDLNLQEGQFMEGMYECDFRMVWIKGDCTPNGPGEWDMEFTLENFKKLI